MEEVDQDSKPIESKNRKAKKLVRNDNKNFIRWTELWVVFLQTLKNSKVLI